MLDRYRLRVFQKSANVFVVIALVAVTGGHWALLQTVAWTNMLATNLCSSSFEVAASKTFDGRHPCGLCKAISSGKQSEKRTVIPAPLKQLEFASACPVFVFAPPQDFCLLGARVRCAAVVQSAACSSPSFAPRLIRPFVRACCAGVSLVR